MSVGAGSLERTFPGLVTRHLALVIPSLEAGGAERVITSLANAWAQAGRPITLLTLADTESDFYPLHAAVRRVALGVLQRGDNAGSPAFLATRKALRQALIASEADVVVSFILKMNVLTLEAARGLPMPVVVSERISPQFPFPWVWRALRRWYYPRAQALVVQTDAAASGFGHLNTNVRKIENPVRISRDYESRAEAIGDAERLRILAVGRLVKQKGFDLLLDAFSLCRLDGETEDWELVIVGEGPDRSALEEDVQRRGLASQVHLPGACENIDAQFAHADLFVLSSRYEGFPNVLVEAMSAGTPVVSFDCPDGPSDIIRHGQTGLLVAPNDTAALAKAMRQLMLSAADRRRFGAAGRHDMQRFSLEVVLEQWERLFDDVQSNG